MKILLITSSFLPKKGGAEFAVHNLANNLSLQGNDVTVLNAVSNVSDSSAKYSVMEINNFINKNIVNYWKNKGTDVFKNKDLFRHINKKIFFVIYLTAFLPKLVRKIVARIILLF